MKLKALTAFLLGWFFPGLGHFVQKKIVRGSILAFCLISMAAVGIFMGGRIYHFQLQNPLTILAFFSDIGTGFFYILSRFIPIGTGNPEAVTFDFGTAYIAGAGLLNYLVALDAYDIASGKKE